MREWMGERWEGFLVVGLALMLTCLVALASDPLSPGHPNFPLPADHHKYMQMAEREPGEFHIAPFCWRIFVPAAARILPFDLQLSFQLIVFLSIWGTGVLLYLIVRRTDLTFTHGLLALLMFYGLGYAGKFVFYDFWLPDATAFLFIALGVYAIVSKNNGLFLIAVLVGVTVKESVLFVVPLYYSLQASRIIDRRLLLETALLALPGLVTLVAIRVFIPALNNDPAYLAGLPEALRLVANGSSQYGYWHALTTIGVGRLQEISALSLYLYSFGTFGVLVTSFALVALRKHLLLFIRFLPFFLLVYTQLLFAVDGSRLLIAGFVGMIVLAVRGMDSLARWWRVPVGVFVPLASSYLCFNLVPRSFGPTSPMALLLQFSLLFGFLILMGYLVQSAAGVSGGGRKNTGRSPAYTKPFFT